DLEVAVAVPGQRRHAVGGTDAQAPERVRELARTRVRVAVAVAVDAAIDVLRDDLGVAVVPRGVLEQPADEQRLIHHEALHDSLPPRDSRGSLPRESGR